MPDKSWNSEDWISWYEERAALIEEGDNISTADAETVAEEELVLQLMMIDQTTRDIATTKAQSMLRELL